MIIPTPALSADSQSLDLVRTEVEMLSRSSSGAMAFFYLIALFFVNIVHAGVPNWPSSEHEHGHGGYGWGQYAGFPSLINATIDELAAGLAQKRFTSVDLVNAYLARITEVNGTLHMVTEVNPDALSIAAALDAERAAGKVRGPLHGIPILIKNNIATADKMNNTAGSWSLVGAKVPRDSTIASKLRSSGAVILGKTNLSQWANFRSFNTSNGWSAYGGQTYAAYYPNQDPSGSSSGSGVASSLGLAAVCLGSETDGSIVSPSSDNNLVGIKPSVGLTSRYLVIPISEHQDTVGPMARTVKDAAYVLQAIAGVDPNDNYTSAIPNGGKLPDYIAALNYSALAGARIGIPWNVIDLFSTNNSQPIVDSFLTAVGVLKSAGAVIVNNTNFPAAEAFLNSTAETTVLEADFINNLANYLSELTYNPNNIHSLADERAFTQSFPLEDYPERDTGLWDQALGLGFNNTAPQFWAAYQQQLYFGGPGGLLGTLANYSLDAVILPTDFSSTWAAGVGAPIVTVPMGSYPPGTPVINEPFGVVSQAPNIPFGISFLGARFTEAKLIGLAYSYEQRTHIRDTIQPYIEPKTELADVCGGKPW